MALKATVHEKCPSCGQRAARRIGDRIIDLAHKCPARAPGPPIAPRSLRARDVVFVPGDFDVAFLRGELDEAWRIIEDLREKRWQAERDAVESLRAAMAAVYSS